MFEAASTECLEHCWGEVKTCITTAASVGDVAANSDTVPGDIDVALALGVIVWVLGHGADYICVVDADMKSLGEPTNPHEPAALPMAVSKVSVPVLLSPRLTLAGAAQSHLTS